MTIRALTAFLASTGALWTTAGESRAQSYDDGGAYVGPYEDPAFGYAPQYGPVRVVAGPISLDVVQIGDGRVVAHVVQSQVSLDQLYDTRLLLGFQGFVGGDSVTLTYSRANNAYFGTLPRGATLGAAPAYAQVLFPDVIMAPPPVVHVVPYPRAPVVVYPRHHVRPRFVVRPHFPHYRPAPPPVVRVDPRGSWQRAHVVRRWDGRGHDGRGHEGRGHDGRGHGGGGRDGRGHGGGGHDGRGHGGHRR